jgi:uncharacterized protein YlxW (UPF0749 family)
VHTLRDITPYLATAATVVSLVALVLLALLWRASRRLRRSQTVVLGPHEQRDLVAHAEHLSAQVRNLREAVEALTAELDTHRLHLDEALTNHAIVRYDAFRDTGGEQSTSIALLDNHRSGIVVSTISARDFARLYVKTLDHGVPDRELSPEELQAVQTAAPTPQAPPAGALPQP